MAGPNILSLFSGVGGLELAVRLALPGSRVVGYVERDAYASAALMARMEESSLDPAPVFVGEIQQLDGRELRGEVDVVCGGIPCQPYSVAGNQLGNEDDRALWHEFARIVAECSPSLVFIENVPTFVTGGGFRPLGEELCRLGFELADPFFVGAGDLGAPHERKRVFILAYRDLDGSETEWRERELDEGERASLGDDTDGRDEELGDADECNPDWERPAGLSGEEGSEAGSCEMADAQDGDRRGGECGEEEGTRKDGKRRRRSPSGDETMADAEGRSTRNSGRSHRAGSGGLSLGADEAVADAGGSGREGRKQRGALSGDGGGEEAYGSASKLRRSHGRAVGEREVPDAERDRVWDEPGRGCGEGWANPSVFEDLGLFPPGPDDWGGWERVFERARFLAPALEPGFRVVADGLPVVLDEGGPDQLRCAGNAVVVAQAYVAFRQLLRWIGRG